VCVLVLNYKALFFLSERALTMKYVLVTGGVVSGLGKGVTASSIGVLLKACGLRVTSIKIGMCVCVHIFLIMSCSVFFYGDCIGCFSF
jgi:hypothetical protein